jgi:hypothetical protein
MATFGALASANGLRRWVLRLSVAVLGPLPVTMPLTVALFVAVALPLPVLLPLALAMPMLLALALAVPVLLALALAVPVLVALAMLLALPVLAVPLVMTLPVAGLVILPVVLAVTLALVVVAAGLLSAARASTRPLAGGRVLLAGGRGAVVVGRPAGAHALPAAHVVPALVRGRVGTRVRWCRRTGSPLMQTWGLRNPWRCRGCVLPVPTLEDPMHECLERSPHCLGRGRRAHDAHGTETEGGYDGNDDPPLVTGTVETSLEHGEDVCPRLWRRLLLGQQTQLMQGVLDILVNRRVSGQEVLDLLVAPERKGR